MRLPQTKAFLPLESFSQIRGALEKLTPKQSLGNNTVVNLSLFLTVVQSKAARETPDTSAQPGF